MNNSSPYKTSLIYLVLLTIGSLLFYKERMLFADPAFIAFEIINTKDFVISEHRYGAFITQFFPLLSAYLGVPLKLILLLYSVSFYIFFVSVTYLCGSILNQKKLAILFVFYLCFLVTDVYFWPNNEIHQSAGWMILFLGLYNYSVNKLWKVNKLIHIALTLTLFFSIISHMLILIPITYLWCYNFLERTSIERKNKYFLFYSILIISFSALRYFLSHNSWYDGVKLQGIKQISIEGVINAFTNDHSLSILNLFATHYWLLLIVFLIGLISLISKKKISLSVLTVSYMVLYYLLLTLTFSDKITASNLFYFESQWMGLTFIACAPFLFESIDHIKNKRILITMFVLIFILKIPYLYNSLSKFKSRLAKLQTLVDDSRNKDLQKCYILDSVELNQSILLTWGIPAESLLLSSLNNNQDAISIKVFEQDSRISNSTDSIYTSFKLIPASKLNSDYFKFSENSNYVPLYDLHN